MRGGRVRRLRRREHLRDADRARAAPGHPDRRARRGRVLGAQADPGRRERGRLALQGERAHDGEPRAASHGDARPTTLRDHGAGDGAATSTRLGASTSSAARRSGHPPGPVERLRAVVADVAAALRGGDGEAAAPDARAAAAGGVRRLLDERRDAARARAEGAAARDRGARSGRSSSTGLGDVLERVEVAGPGFLNLFLSDAWFRARARRPCASRATRFGAGVVPPARARADPGRVRERESDRPADRRRAAATPPTGTRSRACSSFAGHEVEREYYVNDYGTQVELFGRSIAARDDAASRCPRAATRATTWPSSPSGCAARASTRPTSTRSPGAALELMVERGARDARALPRAVRPLLLRALAARRRARSSEALAQLERAGHVYASEGATWLRTTAFGDDKDRVLRRSSGELDLLRVGHRLPPATSASAATTGMINVLGADHHGYVAPDAGRLRGARRARAARDDHHAARPHRRARRARPRCRSAGATS